MSARQQYEAKGYVDAAASGSFRISECPYADGWQRDAWQAGAWRWMQEQRALKAKTKTEVAGSFIAYPRSNLDSFPPISSPTVAGAVSAGLATGRPFDVHTPGGAIAWGWEQRSDEHRDSEASRRAKIRRDVDAIVADERVLRRRSRGE